MQGFRALPSVDQLLQSETGLGLIAEHGRAMVTRTARARLDLARAAIRQGADGAVDSSQHPPGYQQVGNERYGQWRNDGGGRSFWEFYGQYALLSHVIGGFGRPVYRNDWNGYQTARGRGQTYYGPGREYGSNGSVTRQTNPNFFRRQQARQAASSRSFGDRVRSRTSGGTRFGGK